MLATLALVATHLLFLCPSTISAASDNHVALFVFGDSLYDAGMSFFDGIPDNAASRWPYGETYFNHPAGRFSDGRVIPDFIAEFAELPFPKPYLLPGLNNYTNGINFASTGATVLVENHPYSGFDQINFKKQVNYFLQMVQKLKQQLGVAKANELLSKAVYLFNVGVDDYFTLLLKNIDESPLSPSDKYRYMNMVLGNLTIHIRTMYQQGGRRFAFQNIGSFGCSPFIKYMLGYNGTCEPEVRALAKMHNNGFLKVAQKLQSELPEFKYTVYDHYSSFYRRIVNGNSYGFKEVETACCGSGPLNGQYTCSSKGGNFSVCSNPSEYLFFDGVGHATDKANQQFSMEFWSGGPDVVAPYNLKTLFYMDDEYLLGLHSSMRR